MARIKRITIVGLGLMGGSLGMALRRKKLADEVVGLSRSSGTVRKAIRLSAIDRGTTDPKKAVQDSDIVVLACPIESMLPRAKKMVPFMKKSGILTDVGSTKNEVVRKLEKCKKGISFVGTHPLAGSEKQGIEAARPDLFDGSVCILTRTSRTDKKALKAIAGLWRRLGCRVCFMSPSHHDRLLAGLSHLPHIIAFSLVDASNKSSLSLAPRSFLDATRVAKSDSELWDDIFFSNKSDLLKAMDVFERSFSNLKSIIKKQDRKGLKRFLANAKKVRENL